MSRKRTYLRSLHNVQEMSCAEIEVGQEKHGHGFTATEFRERVPSLELVGSKLHTNNHEFF